VIEALIAEGVDIDANLSMEDGDTSHESMNGPALTLERTPSAEHGAAMLSSIEIPPEVSDPDWRRSHTPREALDLLRAANPPSSQTDLVDVVAYLWTSRSSPDILAAAQVLYNKNCAACHGQYGGGDGPAADLAAQNPVVFADPAYMLERRSDVLYAKIRRGGMGTDMPNFGTLLTTDETWALVEYIWSLSMDSPPKQ
jgi:mono/diheme cytochrome c family protein